MKRLIEEKLLKWKNNPSRMPLILDGARRAGFAGSKAAVMEMLARGTAAAVKKTNETLARVRKAIGIL